MTSAGRWSTGAYRRRRGRGRGRVRLRGARRGGAAHPAWFNNLSSQPKVEVQVEGRSYRARARILEGEERERCYRQVVAQAARFGEYERKAGGARQIPVVELVEAGASA